MHRIALLLIALLAGCASPPQTADAPLDEAADQAPAETAGLVEEVDFMGDLTAERSEIVAQQIGRELLSGELTLTWSADSAEAEELVAEVWMFASCPDGCHRHEQLTSVEGASPLTIQVDPRGFEEGETIGIYVRAAEGDDPLDLFGSSVEQDFEATGSWTFKA